MSYQEWAGWKEKEQKTVANVVKSGIIQGEDTKSIGFQFFANKSIPSRSDRELQKSIVLWQKNISVHLKNLLNYATIVLIALRACDVIAWSWYVVLSPILAKVALFLVASIVIDYILLQTGKMSAFYMNRFVLLQINS